MPPSDHDSESACIPRFGKRASRESLFRASDDPDRPPLLVENVEEVRDTSEQNALDDTEGVVAEDEERLLEQLKSIPKRTTMPTKVKQEIDRLAAETPYEPAILPPNVLFLLAMLLGAVITCLLCRVATTRRVVAHESVD